jgi:hypothetical protein
MFLRGNGPEGGDPAHHVGRRDGLRGPHKAPALGRLQADHRRSERSLHRGRNGDPAGDRPPDRGGARHVRSGGGALGPHPDRRLPHPATASDPLGHRHGAPPDRRADRCRARLRHRPREPMPRAPTASAS